MKPTLRPYRRGADYDQVGRFLVRTYQPTGEHVNWLQPRWEYMHYHPLSKGVDLNAIGVWELAGRIVGVVHPEHRMDQAYFEIDPDHGALKGEMLVFAEEHLAAATETGRRLAVFINDADLGFQGIAAQRGYERSGRSEPMTMLPIPKLFPSITLPAGFRLQSLADDNDLWRVHGVLWRGFDHGDDPPRDELADREFMQSAPNFRRDLNIVVVAPDESFVSYCGMWMEPVHRVAYVEPVATDPKYRRMGLGSAAVREGIRRGGRLGATVAYVGSTLPIYRSLGFRQIYNCSLWCREWT
jgi:predicted N-acetyltransferase YhbS